MEPSAFDPFAALRRSVPAIALAAAAITGIVPPALAQAPSDDPYAWLEEVTGDRALAWVRERNAETTKVLEARPDYAPTRDRLRRILDSKDRIPTVQRMGPWLYNFWRDESHKRGLWRRATLDEYRKPQPAWEPVLDLDALGEAEKESWVWGGADCLPPAYRQCLVALSRGGADAKVVREFDVVAKRFAAGGFETPEAKSRLVWVDASTVFVATDFGPGSMTDSGYPRIIRRWTRGTPLASAPQVFEGEAKDVEVSAEVDLTPGYERTLFVRSTDFYRSKTALLQNGRLVPLDVPDDARVRFDRDTLLLELRSDLQVGETRYPSGSLLAIDARRFLAGDRRFEALFTPTPTRSLADWATTRDHVVGIVLDNVAGRLLEWRRQGGRYAARTVEAPFPGTLEVASLYDPNIPRDPLGERYLLSYNGFLTPDTLYLATAGSDAREVLKSRPAQFDAEGMRVEQRFARSTDGTRVPYFVVWPKSAAAGRPLPTLLYGYGGFEVAMNPRYYAGFGAAWLERGGVYVLANIRGGGEFGPRWHQTAILENKQRSYDDFIAVAEDLIATKTSDVRHLGIEGGSNGGLLMGAVTMQRPDLFNAVVCQVPLLDMRRYHKLLAGASWMAEYGDPDDPAQWSWISRYSPYQNVQPGKSYPRMLFTTSTRDDRVHPGHARKMAAKMLDQGHPVLYYENIEGGHGGAADNEQRARMQALEFTYLWMQLGGAGAPRESATAADGAR